MCIRVECVREGGGVGGNWDRQVRFVYMYSKRERERREGEERYINFSILVVPEPGGQSSSRGFRSRRPIGRLVRIRSNERSWQ